MILSGNWSTESLFWLAFAQFGKGLALLKEDAGMFAKTA